MNISIMNTSVLLAGLSGGSHRQRRSFIAGGWLVVLWLAGPATTLVMAQTTPMATPTEGSDFENGLLAPYATEALVGDNSATVITTPFPARSGSKAVQIIWKEDNWDPAVNSRAMRGNEIRSNLKGRKDVWSGFSMYMKPGEFPTDKQLIINQIHCYDQRCNADKSVSLGLTNTSLKINGYANATDPTNALIQTSKTLTGSLPLGRWIDVIIHARFSQNGTGLLECWFDGAAKASPTARVTNINLGSACFNSNDEPTYGAYVKYGLYCFDKDNYSDHEVRTMYVDEVRWIDGDPGNAWELVNPGQSIILATTAGKIAQKPDGQFYLYPNPSADGSFRLMAGQETHPTIELLNLTGATLSLPSVRPDGATGEVVVTPAQALPVGLYHVRVQTSAGQQRVLRLLIGSH